MRENYNNKGINVTDSVIKISFYADDTYVLTLDVQSPHRSIGTTQNLVWLFILSNDSHCFCNNRLFNLNGIWRILVWPWPDRLLQPCPIIMWNLILKKKIRCKARMWLGQYQIAKRKRFGFSNMS